MPEDENDSSPEPQPEPVPEPPEPQPEPPDDLPPLYPERLQESVDPSDLEKRNEQQEHGKR